MAEDEAGFDASKAELFEAVGHPYRIRILQALSEGALGFAELRKRVGMESSGHLAFHLGKLHHLVTMNAVGQYTLTGEGREALSMIHAVKERNGERQSSRGMEVRKSVLAVLVILVLVLSLVAAFQQLQIAGMSSSPPGTVTLGGRPFWYAVIPLAGIPTDRNTSFVVDGVNFTLIPFHFLPANITVTVVNGTLTAWNGTGSVRISASNGTVNFVVPKLFTLVFYPNIQIRFQDGATEALVVGQSTGRVTTAGGSGNVSFPASGSPWFSEHRDPQVAILENSTSITLYVSV